MRRRAKKSAWCGLVHAKFTPSYLKLKIRNLSRPAVRSYRPTMRARRTLRLCCSTRFYASFHRLVVVQCCNRIHQSDETGRWPPAIVAI